jgi:hypothetical protein
MGLICNGYRNGHSPFQHRAGALVSIYGGGWRGRSYLPGMMHNWNTHTTRDVALPMGNLHPHSWMLPRTGGGMSLRADGAGSIAANLYPTRPMSIDLTGAGDLEATAALVISMLCAMSGSGSLTATIEGRLNMSADLTGSGDLAADLSGIASMAIDLLGAGDLEATIAAYGNMEIDIVVTGTGLSTANVGQAVWNYLIESSGGNEVVAVEALRILLAEAAGKISGAGTATETFRSVLDHKDRITATVDASGNRTTIVLDKDP